VETAPFPSGLHRPSPWQPPYAVRVDLPNLLTRLVNLVRSLTCLRESA